MQRLRRGKLVDIPDQWLGKVTTDKTKRDRKTVSLLKKLKRRSDRRKNNKNNNALLV